MGRRSQGHKLRVQGIDSSGRTPAALAITTLTPSTGVNSTSVAITVAGTGFASTDKITFRGVDYAITYTSSLQIASAAPIPLGAAGTIPVTVKRADGSLVSNAVNFTVT